MARHEDGFEQPRRCFYIEASPRKTKSISVAAARAFLAELQRLHPDVLIDTLDLWESRLPEFNGAAVDAKYASLAGLALSEEQQAAWRPIGQMIDRLKAADALVVSTPMWNFGIPYKLKHWIDLITQPGLTFSFDAATGYEPLLDARPTLVILSSAGDYAGGPSRGRPDLATPYLSDAFKFIGLKDLTLVRVGPTVGAAAVVASAKAGAERSLIALATSFMGAAR